MIDLTNWFNNDKVYEFDYTKWDTKKITNLTSIGKNIKTENLSNR